MPIIDAVSVFASDMRRAIGFYSALGFDFAGADPAQDHVEPARMPGGPRLIIDSVTLLRSLSGAEPRAASHAAFALLCDGPAAVDAAAAKIAAAGFEVVKAPWDAFWGQRYAVVRDPDGTLVDLFAPL